MVMFRGYVPNARRTHSSRVKDSGTALRWVDRPSVESFPLALASRSVFQPSVGSFSLGLVRVCRTPQVMRRDVACTPDELPQLGKSMVVCMA
jgi:hypothetical protein